MNSSLSYLSQTLKSHTSLLVLAVFSILLFYFLIGYIISTLTQIDLDVAYFQQRVIFIKTAQAQTQVIGLVREDCTGYANCFTSLSQWEANYGGIDFGVCTDGDLVCADTVAVVQIDGTWTNPDTSFINIDGWNTDATHYIRIYTTSAARHDGKWNTGKYRLEYTTTNSWQAAILIEENNVRIEGLQIELTSGTTHNDTAGIKTEGLSAAAADLRISHNIIKAVRTGSANSYGIFIYDPNATSKTWNNIIYDFTGGTGTSNGILMANGGTHYAYNNTVYNCDYGYRFGAATTFVVKNNIAQDCNDGFFDVWESFESSSDYNISDLAGDAPGSSSKNSTNVTFVDEANDDFHLSSSDTAAKDAGTDLSADVNLSFSDDMDGDSRTGTWDIGADEYMAGASDTTPPTRSNGSPSGALASGTTQTTMSLTTNENATCKYLTTAGTVYSSVTNTFTTTGGINHSTTITGLTDGNSYSYYIRCQDIANNANTDDYTISFSVASSGGGASDTTPPAAITDLTVPFCNPDSCTLSWTAPGDDGNTGTASSYDIRYSTSNITQANWSSASQVTGKSTPSIAGASETHTITGLSLSTTYYFAIKASDEVPNESSLSNVPTGTALSSSVTAFPGAEGFGANSVGGRGGTVIKVINLNDAGPGSFREAVEAPPRSWADGTYNWESIDEYQARLNSYGPRIVVFEVSGIINLESDLWITYPYLTIAGQTSPGGILVTGYQTTVKTHDVIMQHMRFRVGSHRIADGADPEQLDSFDIWGPYWGEPVDTYNVIIDHCSFSWGVDETFTSAGGVLNATIQWSIFSEGLSQAGHPKGEHSKGLMISGKYTYPNSVSVHHNYIAHNRDRNPLISSPDGVDVFADAVNNVAYNWYGCLPMISQGSPKTNWVHNYAKQGPESNPSCYEIYHYPDGCSSSGDYPGCQNPIPLIYVEGNLGLKRLDQAQGEWDAVGYIYYDLPLDEGYRQLTPWPASPITTTEMSYAYALEILNDVGATRPVRDSVDERVIADFDAGTGAIIDNVVYPDDFPTFTAPPYPTDVDNDGMADNWEVSEGLKVGVDDSALDENSDGYTNIEEYLYYLSTGATINIMSPSRFNGSPTGVLPAGTSTITLSLITDKSATCRYATATGVAYASMTNTFATTGNTSHSQTVTGLKDGTIYNYYVRCLDSSLNANPDDYTISFSIASAIPDTEPPIGSILINNDDTYASSTTVNLSLSATDASGIEQMKIANLDDFDSVVAEAYNTVKSWTLSIGDGLKTVYTWFKDTVGNWSVSYSDIITLDTTYPTIFSVASSNITTNSANISWNTNESSTLQIEYGLTPSYGQLTTLNPSLFNTSHSVSLGGLSDDTTYNYRVRSIDQAGNESVSINQTLITQPAVLPDTTPPADITDLLSSNISQTSVDLAWTAVGDDNGARGPTGVAYQYDLRYSISYLSDSSSQTDKDTWWNNALEVSGEPTPQVAGSEEYISVGLSPAISYYFTLKTSDEVPNWSGLSNIISVTTLEEQEEPGPEPTVTPSGGGGGGGAYQDTIPPVQPADFEATPADKQITLTWTNPQDTDFVRVKILRKENEAPASHDDSTALIIYEGINQEHTDIDLDNEITYYYAIYAYDKKPNYSVILTLLAQPEAGKESIALPKKEPAAEIEPSLPYPNGSLLHDPTTNRIYFIVNNQKRWITSPAVFLSYDLTAGSQITVDSSILDQYELGLEISQPSLPEGILIRAKDDYKIYIIKPPFKRHIFNPAIFDMYEHFDWQSIQEVEPDIVTSYITSDLYRALNDYRVYSLEEVDEVLGNAIKHHLNMTPEQFINKGYSWQQIFMVNPQERDYYETGEDLE